jgi:glycosyltransferase involved in cell wall biosynthesis
VVANRFDLLDAYEPVSRRIMTRDKNPSGRPQLLVLASTYPRWNGDPEPGFVHELCRRLSERFNVIALVPDAPQADPCGSMDGVEVIRYRYAPRRWQTLVNNGGIAQNLRRFPWKWLLVPGFMLAQYFAARRLLARRPIDVIHAHWLIPQGLIALLLRAKARKPYVVTSHGGDLFGLQHRMAVRLMQRIGASSCAMTVVSTAMQAEAMRLGLHSPRLEVLPMGVDLSSRFVSNGAIPRSANELLFVGRLVPKKGLTYLLNALPRIITRYPNAILKIVGFGPEEAALRSQSAKLGLEHAVHFLGALPQAELPILYQRAAVFVAPFVRDESGDQEGLPVALMEAIGCGCPVVVGKLAGIQDLLGSASEEFCVSPSDVPGLATSIIRALDNPGRAAEMVARIRHRVLPIVDWQSVSSAYARLLEACIIETPAFPRPARS